MNVVVAVDGAHGRRIASGLEEEGVGVRGVVPAASPALAVGEQRLGADPDSVVALLREADALILEVSRSSVSPALVAWCDRSGVRIVPLCASDADERVAAAFRLAAPTPLAAQPWMIADGLRSAPAAQPDPPRDHGAPLVIAVWGPAGAPGRSTVAVELSVELARGGRAVSLVDADTHAPSIALSLGLADEGPGFAAACRQAEHGALDARELTRIALPLGRSGVHVLTGLNRPSRWPELSDARVFSALEACRTWSDYTVVDVAAPLERDEEIVSDIVGPRRNAATLAALRAADLVVAVVGADPVGVSRFLRALPELRAAIGAAPLAVVANRLRPGALGIDGRGQVRRTLDRFGGIEDVWFLPQDARSADAALLAGQPIASVAPRSAFTLGLRRFVGEGVVGAPDRSEPRRRRARAA